jgi:predicted nucleotidyltransferase
VSPGLSDPRVPIDLNQIRSFCLRWGIVELSLFGSVLRPDFTPSSDVDVLVRYATHPPIDIDDWIRMKGELSALLGREADVVNADLIRNPFRKREIERTRRVIYAVRIDPA